MLGYFYANAKMDTEDFRAPALLGIERNHSSGETVLRLLKDVWSYPRLYYHRQINRRTNRQTLMAGWVTNVENRQVMLDELAQALRENSIHLPNADTIKECFTFIRDDTGKPQAQEGCHDDRVISAAGVLQLARYGAPRRPRPQKAYVGGSSPTGWGDY